MDYDINMMAISNHLTKLHYKLLYAVNCEISVGLIATYGFFFTPRVWKKRQGVKIKTVSLGELY